MTTARNRIDKQAVKVAKDLKEMGNAVRDAAQEKLGQVRKNATDYVGQGRDKARSVVGDFEQYIRERPVTTILIAAGIGLLFGRFWKRR